MRILNGYCVPGICLFTMRKKCLTKWMKIHALMELNNNLEWFPKHLRRHVARDAPIIGCFYAMHSVRCFKSICPLIFIDSIVKQLYQGSTIYRYLYTWGNGSSKKSHDLPKVSLLVNHRTRTQTQAGWLQNPLCYTWDGGVVPACEMSPKWWRGSWVLCRMNNGNSRNCRK